MLPSDVEALVAAIASDLDSGASELTVRALEAFEALLPVDPSAKAVEELAAKLAAAQPNMASVRNVAQLCARLVARSSNPPAAFREIRRELSGAHERIARNAIEVIAGKPTVVTISRSLAVTAILKSLQSRRRLTQVFILESLPGREGRRTAAEFAAAGIPSKLVADDLAQSLVRRSDVVLTGADTVLLDGTLVNKVGTHDLALACEAWDKPFYAACEALKIDSLRTAQTFPPPDPASPEAEVVFDLTPAQFIRSFITDKGVFEPKDIARVWLL